MRSEWRRGLGLLLSSLALGTAFLAGAPAALATFHLVSIREVYPGSAAKPTSEYVELQMWSAGQGLVEGHFVRTYDAAGNPTGTSSFDSDLGNDSNQSTMVLATPEAEAEFGFTADAVLGAGGLGPGGGAVCWEAIDCVSWGNFSGSTPSPVGSPASSGGIPEGMALRRTIAPGCPTRLEGSDDRDDSSIDFFPASPAPRPNPLPPSERACSLDGGGTSGPVAAGGAEDKSGAPQTSLRRTPPRRGHDRTPTFRFAADEPGVRFECRLDHRAFRPCRSPYTLQRLAFGPHSFRVRAREDSGPADPTPARFAFTVLAPRRG